MPVTKSAKKALRQSLRKAVSNKPVKTRARSLLKQAKLTPTVETIANAMSSLDKAVKKNIFHKNKVNRLKSGLAKLTSQKTKSEK